MVELKISIEIFNSRPNQAAGRIKKLKDVSFEIIQFEEQKEKRIEKVKKAYRAYGISSRKQMYLW